MSRRQHTKTIQVQEQTITPLWLVALVDKKGQLKSPNTEASSPFWIRRDYQSPNTDRVEYCSIDDSDQWLTQNIADSLNKNWKGYIQSAKQYYNAVGSSAELMSKYDFTELFDKCVIMACTEIFGKVGSILQCLCHPSQLRRGLSNITESLL